METIQFDFRKLSEILLASTNYRNINALITFLKDEVHLNDEKTAKTIKTIQKNFLSKFYAAYKKYHFNKNSFFSSKSNDSFLNSKVTVKFEETVSSVQTSSGSSRRGRPPKELNTHGRTPIVSKKRGPKPKPYEEVTDRTRRRKAALLRNEFPKALLLHAVQPYQHEENEERNDRYTEDEALALFLNAKLTKSSYKEIQQGGNRKRRKIYPCYDNLVEAKKRCYPANISVSETGASIPLQDLMDHTIRRMLNIDPTKYLNRNVFNLTLLAKYGMDGATGQSIYKQKFEGAPDLVENSIVLCCMVPLMLTDDDNGNAVMWENNVPSSPIFCRPISFEFVRETEELTLSIDRSIKEEIANLTPFRTRIEETTINVRTELKFCMVDGKVSTYLLIGGQFGG